MSVVTILNLGGQEVLGHVDVRHAIRLVYKQKARIFETVPGAKFGPFDLPRSIELLQYVYAKWKYQRTGEVPFSKRGVLKRDGFVCCYCGKKNATTVDHVLPKWQGNVLSWNNAVASCYPCNSKKGGRSPKEAGMKMLYQPRTPSFDEAYNFRRN